MTKFHSFLMFFLAWILGPLCFADFQRVTPEEAGYDATKLKDLTGITDRLYNDGRIPNYIISLYKNDKNFFQASRGFTALEDGEPIDENTIFHTASMSKPMVTTALFRLIQDGKISLEDHLDKFFPQFEQMMVAPGGDFSNQFEPAKRKITIRDLVTHTSGFSYGQAVAGFGDVGKIYDELNLFFDSTKKVQEHLDNLAEIPLVAHPGQEFNYSVGIDVVGAIIEKVSGETLASFMKKFLFDPLGMNSTGFVLSAQQAKQSSNVYGSQPMNPNQPFELIGKVSSNVSSIDWKIGQVIPSIAFTVEPMFYSGGGGIFSSAKDYATYLTMIANEGSFDGGEILKPEFAKLHTASLAPGISAEGFLRAFGDAAEYMGFGGGFGIKNEPENNSAVDYIFWAGAFNTFFWVDLEDKSVGLFLTSHWPVQYNISDGLEQIVDEARL